jgi:hypothetical protein
MPPGTRVAQEYTSTLDGTALLVGPFYSLANRPNWADYQRDGFEYLITSDEIGHRYRDEPKRYHAKLGFYRSLDGAARLVARFTPSFTRGGPEVRIYQLPDRAP